MFIKWCFYNFVHSPPPPFYGGGTYLCSNCWDQISQTCRVFTRLFTLNNPRYFLDFALSVQNKMLMISNLSYIVLISCKRLKAIFCLDIFFIDTKTITFWKSWLVIPSSLPYKGNAFLEAILLWGISSLVVDTKLAQTAGWYPIWKGLAHVVEFFLIRLAICKWEFPVLPHC